MGQGHCRISWVTHGDNKRRNNEAKVADCKKGGYDY